MKIEQLISEIIPPSDYKHRNGFNNTPLIDKLTVEEKLQLEDALIHKLLFESEKDVDTLMIETLAYLKSQKCLPVLKGIIDKCSDDLIRLKIASAIFEINGDSNMMDIAIASFRKLDDNKNAYYTYSLTSAFYYLIKFKKRQTNEIIEEYIAHKDYLVSYNAKRTLEIIDNK